MGGEKTKLSDLKVAIGKANCKKTGESIYNCIYQSQLSYKKCAETCNPKPEHSTFMEMTK